MDHVKIIRTAVRETFNLLNFYDNIDTSKMLDPMTLLVRLAVLSIMPEKTKLSIHNNSITFHYPTILQGTIRWSMGDKGADVHNICKPIQVLVEWYNKEKASEEIKYIFTMAVKGLRLLKKSYTSPEHSIISHCIEHYSTLLQQVVDENKISPIENENATNTGEILFYKNFDKNWEKKEIKIIHDLLQQADNMKDNNNPYLDAINILLNYKDNLTRETIRLSLVG